MCWRLADAYRVSDRKRRVARRGFPRFPRIRDGSRSRGDHADAGDRACDRDRPVLSTNSADVGNQLNHPEDSRGNGDDEPFFTPSYRQACNETCATVNAKGRKEEAGILVLGRKSGEGREMSGVARWRCV